MILGLLAFGTNLTSLYRWLKNLHGSFHSTLLHFLCQALSCYTKTLATRGPANGRYKRKHISMLVWQQILPGSLSVRWDYCGLDVAKAATTNYNESWLPWNVETFWYDMLLKPFIFFSRGMMGLLTLWCFHSFVISNLFSSKGNIGYPYPWEGRSSCSPNNFPKLADTAIIESIYRWYMLVYISGTLPRVPNFPFDFSQQNSQFMPSRGA